MKRTKKKPHHAWEKVTKHRVIASGTRPAVWAYCPKCGLKGWINQINSRGVPPCIPKSKQKPEPAPKANLSYCCNRGRHADCAKLDCNCRCHGGFFI